MRVRRGAAILAASVCGLAGMAAGANAAQWSPAQRLGRGDPFSPIALAAGPRGQAMAMWKTRGLVPGTRSRPQEGNVIVASARAPRGRFGRVRRIRYDAETPRVAFAGGRFWATWTWRGRDARQERGEFASSAGGSRFSARRRLAKPFSELLADEAGTLYGRTDVGGEWLPGSEEEQLRSVALGMRAGRLPFAVSRRVSGRVLDWSSAVAGRHGLVAAWIEVAGSDSRLRVQRWSARGPRGPALTVAHKALAVCRSCGDEEQDVTYSELGLSHIAANRRGDAGVVWMEGDAMRATALPANREPATQTIPTPPNVEDGYSEPEGVSVDPSGALTVIWIHSRSAYVDVPRSLFATRMSPGQEPSPPQEITRSRGWQDMAVATTSRGVTLIGWASFAGRFYGSSAAPGRPFSRGRLLTSRRLRRGPRTQNPDDTYMTIAADGRGGAALTFTIPGAFEENSDSPAYNDVLAVAYRP